MGRMAVVGCEASGKTVFLSALADLYRPNGTTPAALCLMPENPAANSFAAFQRRQMRSLRQWPPATNPDKTLRMDWSLRAGGKTVTDVTMLEFGGETFRAAFRGSEEEPEHKEAVAALLNYLSEADFIVVLVSIKELMRDPGNVSADQFERDTEAVWVTRGILEFVRTNLPHAGLVIGLTQADRYAAELAAAGSAAQLLSAHWPDVGVLAIDLPVVAVASVSATDEEGRPAEGYTTEGVAPVMRELARQAYGDPETIRAELTRLAAALDGMNPARDPEAYQTQTEEFGDTLDNLAAARALAGDTPGEDVAQARTALARYRTLGEEAREKVQTKQVTRARRGRRLRTFLLALLMLTGAAALVSVLILPEEAGNPFAPYVTRLMEKVQAATEERPAEPVATNVVETVAATNVVAETIAATNDAPEAVATNAVTEVTVTNVVAEVVATNDVAEAIAPTNVVAEVAATNVVAEIAATNVVAEVAATNVVAEASVTNAVPVVAELTPEEREHQRKLRIFDKCQRAAQAGNAKAKRILAGHYRLGSEFVAQDILLARQLYREAAEAGDAKAMYHVGLNYFELVETDPLARARAHEWFEKAKAAGCPAADLDDLIEQTQAKPEAPEEAKEAAPSM